VHLRKKIQSGISLVKMVFKFYIKMLILPSNLVILSTTPKRHGTILILDGS
jgi:hypothetical protein